MTNAMIRLIHWNSDEAHERAAHLAALGYQVNHELPNPPAFVKELAADPPARETGLAAGLVDYKICSIDETWSALLFTRRNYSRAEA